MAKLRKIAEFKAIGSGTRSAKVYKDPEYGEYIVKFYLVGVHHKRADYHTDDKQDALATAQFYIGG